MVIEKTANILAQSKVIYSFVIAVAYGVVTINTYANDQRYMQISNYEVSQIAGEIRHLNREVAKLETQLIYEKSENKVAMLQALIIQLKNDIKDLKGE